MSFIFLLPVNEPILGSQFNPSPVSSSSVHVCRALSFEWPHRSLVPMPSITFYVCVQICPHIFRLHRIALFAVLLLFQNQTRLTALRIPSVSICCFVNVRESTYYYPSISLVSCCASRYCLNSRNADGLRVGTYSQIITIKLFLHESCLMGHV